MVVDMSSNLFSLKHNSLFLAISSSLVSISPYSFAVDTVSQQLPTIQVKATQNESSDSEITKAYTIKDSSSATKLNIAAKETPQTINVVTRQQIEDFGLTSTRDILNNTPGVTVNALETERAVYMARGFEISNILIDGVGFPLTNWNTTDINPDSYFYDRVEVVKGANALTNAFGDPSATINYVRKRPTKEFQANTGLSYGSWDTQRYEADVSGSLNDRIRARLFGFQQTGDSYRDRYSSEKMVLQVLLKPILRIQPFSPLAQVKKRINQMPTTGERFRSWTVLVDSSVMIAHLTPIQIGHFGTTLLEMHLSN